MMESQHRQSEWAVRRQEMVEAHIRSRGVRDERVLEAVMKVPRERFLPDNCRGEAYEDRAVPIGFGQTISQPFIVAFMTEQLSLTNQSRVLEIGTGTGYQTALLALLSHHVYSVERIDVLRDQARETLSDLKLANVSLFVGDGSLGLPQEAPFDRIMVTAAAPNIPYPLVDQLVDHGLMVLPVGGGKDQTIVRVMRDGPRTIETPLLACRFVKLIGREGWPDGNTT